MSIEIIKKSLSAYQEKIDEKIKLSLSIFGPSGTLRDACEYALTTGGRRFRPALVFMVAGALAKPVDVSDAALAIEYFHTASLIADDLPCMDDDDERRSFPSLHKIFGEATALLASYTLIAAGNACIASCAQSLAKTEVNGYEIGILALQHAARSTGAEGATGGQFLDIFPPSLTIESLIEVIQKKQSLYLKLLLFLVGSLVEEIQKRLEEVQLAAFHFGMAFQIADDLGDVVQDAINDRKINTVGLLGIEKAKSWLKEEISNYRLALKALNIDSKELLALATLPGKQITPRNNPTKYLKQVNRETLEAEMRRCVLGS